MPARWLAVLVVTILVLGACWRSKAQGTGKDELVAKCQADLAARLELEPKDVTLASAEEVTWQDASLGCPQPGVDYAMALVPGYRIVLEAAGQTHEYHTDKAERLVYCEQPVAGPDDREGPGPPPPAQDVPIGPEPARPIVLALEAIPDEPNGNSKLVARRLPADDSPPKTVLDRCTDFAAAADGSVLAKRRTSRSGHELVLLRGGGEPTVLMKAFDFEALTFIPPSAGYFFLVKESVGSAFRMYGGEAVRPPVALEWAPEIRHGHGATVDFLQNVAVLSVPTTGDDPGREIIVLDLIGRKLLARFQSAKAAPSLGSE